MKILLVNPRLSNRLRPPLGICYIAAMLEKHNFNVIIFDYLYGLEKQIGKFKATLNREKPDIVGFSSTTPQAPLVFKMAKIVKEFNKNILVVVGGAHSSASPSDMIKDPHIDLGIVGEGEYTMLDIVNRKEKNKSLVGISGTCYIKGGKAFFEKSRPPIEDLSKLPLPARHLLDPIYFGKRNSLIRGCWLKTTTLIASRGCPARCIYCCAHKVFGRKTRYRDPNDTLEEILQLIKEYGIDSIWFADDTFTINKQWLNRLCDLLVKHHNPIVWSCQARANTVDVNILRKMKRAGCIQIEFGVESGSQKVLNALKKGVKVEHVINAFKLCKKFKIRTMANFMIGNPEETLKDIELTRKLVKEIKPNFSEFFIITPFPGTELYRLAKSKGWLKDGDYYYGRESNTFPLNINFNDNQLKKLRKKLFSEFSSPIFHSYLFNLNFLMDLLLYSFRNPLSIFDYFKLLIKGKKFSEIGRAIEQDMRVH